MMQKRHRRLVLILLAMAIIALSASLALYALRHTVTYFYTPTTLYSHLKSEKALPNRTIRLGGYIKAGSIQRVRAETHFTVTDTENEINVVTSVPLPNLFREEQGVVVEGLFNSTDKAFSANRVLAKHDENYRPPELEDMNYNKQSK